MSTAPAPGG